MSRCLFLRYGGGWVFKPCKPHFVHITSLTHPLTIIKQNKTKQNKNRPVSFPSLLKPFRACLRSLPCSPELSIIQITTFHSLWPVCCMISFNIWTKFLVGVHLPACVNITCYHKQSHIFLEKIHSRYAQNEALYSDFIVNQNKNIPSEGKLHAQNSLELKFPFRSSPPFYAKQRTLTGRGKKKDFKIDYAQLSAGPGQRLISRIPCPSCLRDNYSKQPWRRTGPP